MRALLPLGLFASAMFLLSGCSAERITSTTGEVKTVNITIPTPPQFDTIAKSAFYKVSALGMDTLSGELRVESNRIQGAITNIPVGQNRLFEIWIYDYTSALRYYGSAMADVSASETTYVNIYLKKPNGTAVITGTIIDEDSTYYDDTTYYSEYINKPETPWISSVAYSKSLPPIPHISFYTNGSSSSQNHPLGYRWSISGGTVRDTIVAQTDTAKEILYTFGQNGDYKIRVQAVCLQHPDIVSPFSDPMLITIRDGILQDTAQTDTTYSSVVPVITLLGDDTLRHILYKDFTDPGAVAYDSRDGDLTGSIVRSGSVEADVPGVYRLIYSVTNSAGNSMIVFRIVYVLPNVEVYDTLLIQR